MTDAARELRSRVAGRVSENAPLGPLTSFRVGGPADVLVEAEHPDDLVAVAEFASGRLPVAVIGRGSNLLVSDEGFRGVAVRLGRGFRKHRRTQSGFVFGGAVSLPAAARLTAGAGLAGFEFAAEIPGSFGGGVRMNAGAHGRCIGDVLVTVTTVSLETGVSKEWTPQDLDLRYRHSALQACDVVVEGEITLMPDDPDDVAARIAGYLKWRRENQPGGLSAGSVFKNPEGDSAGRLIDVAGLKGKRVGGATVSVVHANFIVAERGATAADVWRLIREVAAVVRENQHVILEPEVKLIGDFPSSGLQLEGEGQS